MNEADPDLSLPQLRPLHSERTRADGRDGIALADPLGLAETCFVPRNLLPLLVRLDGTQDPAAVAAAAESDLRTGVPVEFVEQLVRDLDDRLLLRTPRFFAARDAAVARMLSQPARPHHHAGSAGYPAEPGALRAALTAMVPVAAPAAAPPLRGLIAPHIDLMRGHAGYGSAYGRLLAAPPADLYVVFGTGHQGPQTPVTGLSLDWSTPLGTAPTDRAFVAAVHDATSPPAPEDLLLHRGEHSLEFQVLLLQHLAERRGLPPPRVACFLCGALPSADGDPTTEDWFQRVLAAFRTAEQQSGQRVCYLAGADLAHLGPFFGDPDRIDADRLGQLELAERERLAHLERGHPGAFHRAVEEPGNPDRVCSAPAITLTALLAGGTAEMLHYGQAAADDGNQAVSFCAAAFPG